MENKLYSRRRFFFKAPKKINKIKLTIFLVIILVIFSMVSFFKSSYHIFKASCINEARSLTIRTINLEINKLMKNYTYEDLVTINKDNNGKINFVQTNSRPINEIITELAINVQKDIDNAETTKVFINLGSVYGISFLKYIGPKFNIELETSGNIESNIKTEFTAVGINQTLHKIYLDVSTKISVLTPFGKFRKSDRNKHTSCRVCYSRRYTRYLLQF